MSEPTGPAPASRPAVVPIVLGLLLVAAVIAAALAIERATDSEVELPETLAGGLRLDQAQPVAAADAERELEATLGETVTIRTYSDGTGEHGVALTVVEADSGPFAPDGPQPVPEALGLERSATELVSEGDVLCRVAWPDSVSSGEKVPDHDPDEVFCQLGEDGRTFWLNADGLPVDEAVEILESVTD